MPQSSYNFEVYTDVYVTASVDKNINKFSDEYTDNLKLIKNTLEELGRIREDIRYTEVYDKINNELIEAKQKIADAEQELNDAEQQLMNGKQKIKNSEQELKNQKSKFNSEIAEAQNQIDEYRKQLEYAKLQMHENATLEEQQYYIDAIAEIDKNQDELNSNAANAQKQFNTAQNKLNNAKKELEQKEQEYLDGKLEAEEKIADAKVKIEDGEKKLADLKSKWYILDLNTNVGFVAYGQDSLKISAIGKVFPLIFFLVAALVSLTSMTRMVEEQRMNIGTYKALGYHKFAISFKYLIYSISATIIGIVIGILLGSNLLPIVIFNAYRILYILPDVVTPINLKYTLLASIGALLSTTIATAFACYKELNTTPAYLMRPKAPTIGKLIFLEKIPFIWKRLTFIQKITARNIFRYKKRLFMTIIGIAGCTSLIYTGFGLRDSISSIVNKQYEQIRVYDVEVTLRDELGINETYDINSILDANEDISKYIYIRQQSVEVQSNGVTKDAYAVVIQEDEEIEDFINIRNRETSERIDVSDEGIVITEKLSNMLNIGIGSNIDLLIEDELIPVKIIGVAENYVHNYIYMTENAYNNIYKKQALFNELLINSIEESGENLNNISKDLLGREQFSSVTLTKNVGKSFSNMLDSLIIVVLVLIFAAGALAFVVLFNLNSVNIEERQRELATIKVLGFYDKEVSSYVFRENIILTIIGAILGLGLGVIVHSFVMTTAEVDMVMFSRDKELISFVYSFVLTIIFALVTNFIMNKSIKKIDMIESLKSVE